MLRPRRPTLLPTLLPRAERGVDGWLENEKFFGLERLFGRVMVLGRMIK